MLTLDTNVLIGITLDDDRVGPLAVFGGVVVLGCGVW